MEGNVQEMREALLYFVHDFASFRSDVEHGNLHMMQCMDFVKKYIPLMESALAAPQRNCDVGTADEQLPRFVAAWESAHRSVVDRRSKMMLSVFSRWAQMPYTAQEGAGK